MSSTTTFQKGVQYGFYFDQGRCVDCKTCVVACKSWYNVNPGPAKMCRMFEWESGTFPNVTLHALFAPCYHCANPVCVNYAKGAMFKEPDFGAVVGQFIRRIQRPVNAFEADSTRDAANGDRDGRATSFFIHFAR